MRNSVKVTGRKSRYSPVDSGRLPPGCRSAVRALYDRVGWLGEGRLHGTDPFRHFGDMRFFDQVKTIRSADVYF